MLELDLKEILINRRWDALSAYINYALDNPDVRINLEEKEGKLIISRYDTGVYNHSWPVQVGGSDDSLLE